MLVPGSNLLSLALRVIAPQSLMHKAFVSRTENAAGDTVSTYAEPVAIQGSMQAMNMATYQELGLNIAKNYSTLYTTTNVKPTSRDREGDLVTYGGKTWQCESDMHWQVQDGWCMLLCVEIPSNE